MLSLRAQHPWSVPESSNRDLPSNLLAEGITDRNLDNLHLWMVKHGTGTVTTYVEGRRDVNRSGITMARLDYEVRRAIGDMAVDYYLWSFKVMAEGIEGSVKISYSSYDGYYDAMILDNEGNPIGTIIHYTDNVEEALREVEDQFYA